MPSQQEERISIQPEVGMYAAFARLNYKPWFALGEFVDNAIQSYLENAETLGPKLEVEIEIDETFIRIRDTAAGISWNDFTRAFTPARPPPNRKGLSEFGLGMKAAACWFAEHWTVRTKAAEDVIERQVIFDIPKIVGSNLHELGVIQHPSARGKHYTVVEMNSLRVKLQKKTLAKIKSHLESIYRRFLEDGSLDLTLRYPGGSVHKLSYQAPTLLDAPHYKKTNGPDIRWYKEFSVKLGEGRSVSGWAGLLKVGSVSTAGFSVFRRKRLIQGSHDETYRPEEIFKKPNSFTYQRLVGELTCRGFQVSHTKDGIDWGGDEERLLEELLEKLDAPELPLLHQAENYQARKAAKELVPTFGAYALEQAGEELAHSAPPVIVRNLPPPGEGVDGHSAEVSDDALMDEQDTAVSPTDARTAPLPAAISPPSSTVELTLPGRDEKWLVTRSIVRDATAPWYTFTITGAVAGVAATTSLKVEFNLDHPFSEQFINGNEASLAPLLRIVDALVVAEVTAAKSGGKLGYFRKTFNELLRDVRVTRHEPSLESDA